MPWAVYSCSVLQDSHNSPDWPQLPIFFLQHRRGPLLQVAGGVPVVPGEQTTAATAGRQSDTHNSETNILWVLQDMWHVRSSPRQTIICQSQHQFTDAQTWSRLTIWELKPWNYRNTCSHMKTTFPTKSVSAGSLLWQRFFDMYSKLLKYLRN